MLARLRRTLLGAPRNIADPKTYHHISLVAFLAWVGLGADGLSSSAYGPDEAFRAVGEHHFLAVGLALATTFTVFIISYAYSRIIEHFPFGGGGYVVATRLLGPRFGVVSGSALLVDYVLTISVSIAAAADAAFSFLPPHWAGVKLGVEVGAILLLTVLNLRGVKESVTILAPIFVLFLVTHAVVLLGIMGGHVNEVPAVAREVHAGWQHGVAQLGLAGVAMLFLRAYSMGAGTYTGIEAVSNGLQIMREPKVETGKRTMIYMAVSLALTAGGITLAYLLVHAAPQEGKTMNAVLVESFTSGWGKSGPVFTFLFLAAETALLFVAAQAGFIDGPRVMSNMAVDRWLPARFASLSDRLSMHQGILLIAAASGATLLYTRGDTSTLVLMYSINVFLTFSLSEMGMVRYWYRERRKYPDWKKHISVHLTGLTLCLSILVVSVAEKFTQGGWITLAVTASLVGLCFAIRRHYLTVLLVGGYGGLGIHQLLTVQRIFRGHYKNFLFISVGVIDAVHMKGVEAVQELRERTEADLRKYVALAHRLHLYADFRVAVGTEAVSEAERLCREIAQEYPNAIFFAGKLVFEREAWFQRLLHNETAYQLQRRLQFAGLNAMVLPVRVLEEPKAVAPEVAA